MSSPVARPIRSSSKKLTSSTYPSFGVESCGLPEGARRREHRPAYPSDLFDAARLTPGQIDAELLGRPEHVLVAVPHLDGHTVAGEHLDVEAQRLQLLQQDLERLRDARLGDVLALDDGLVDLDPAEDVVGLDGQQLLQRVRGAVRLHGPALHLTEPLPAELRLTAEGLLGDHRVRTRRASVDLVVDEVEQLEDVDVADGDRLRERLAGTAVEQPRLAGLGDLAGAVPVGPGRPEQADDLLLASAVEDRRGRAGARLPGASVVRQQGGPLGRAL